MLFVLAQRGEVALGRLLDDKACLENVDGEVAFALFLPQSVVAWVRLAVERGIGGFTEETLGPLKGS